MAKRKGRNKSKDWLRRYLPAEIICTITALTAAGGAFYLTQSYAFAAVAGTVGENIGYYGYFIVLEITTQNKVFRKFGFIKRATLVLKKSTRNLLIEFGFAEIFDSFIVRPFAMYAGPKLINPYIIGVLVGKIAADIIFYGIAILGYEGRRKWIK